MCPRQPLSRQLPNYPTVKILAEVVFGGVPGLLRAIGQTRAADSGSTSDMAILGQLHDGPRL